MLGKMRKNAQITLPAKVRRAAQMQEGDIFDIEFENGKIVITPQRIIDKDQAWFWTEEWQAGEREADLNIQRGEVKVFESVEDLIRDLHEGDE